MLSCAKRHPRYSVRHARLHSAHMRRIGRHHSAKCTENNSDATMRRYAYNLVPPTAEQHLIFEE